jgi:hypothetical protein
MSAREAQMWRERAMTAEAALAGIEHGNFGKEGAAKRAGRALEQCRAVQREYLRDRPDTNTGSGT